MRKRKYPDEACVNMTLYHGKAYCGSVPCSLRDELPPPTNGDRMRGMTDAELAQMIIWWQKRDPAIQWCKDEYGCMNLGEDFDCTDELEASCIVRWLRQPAKE